MKTAIDALSHGLRSGELRSASQRRADALVELAAGQLRCGAHRDVHGQRPHLTVTVSAEALRSGSDAPPAELRGVGVIHPATARRLACDAVRTDVTVATLWMARRRQRMVRRRRLVLIGAGAMGSRALGQRRSRWDGPRARSRPTSARRCTSAITAAASRGATHRPLGPMVITSFTGRTAAPPNLRTWSPCAGGITARCTSRGGASTSLMGVPSWSRHREGCPQRSGPRVESRPSSSISEPRSTRSNRLFLSLRGQPERSHPESGGS